MHFKGTIFKVCKPIFSYLRILKNKYKIKLTQLQISEILSNYTSSSKAFLNLQSLIFNSLMDMDVMYLSARTNMNNGNLHL